jgi:hypothetical protein
MTQSPGNRQEDVLGKSQLRKGLQSLERYLVINGWEVSSERKRLQENTLMWISFRGAATCEAEG